MVTGQEHVLLVPTGLDQCILFETKARVSAHFSTEEPFAVHATAMQLRSPRFKLRPLSTAYKTSFCMQLSVG